MDNLVEAPAVGPVRPGGRDYGSPSSARPSRTIGHGRIETVAIASLILTDTPRTSGTDPEHVLRLAEVKEGLPPILVQRSTLRVIDGMHRVKAAMLRGDDTIPVQYFEGSDAESFVQSVQANVAHGLPLSADEREAATERIVRIYPDWSDRAIAAVAGLSPPTVAGIRRRSTEKSSQLNRRVGRDGRRRPVDGAPGRKKAVDIMRERPEAPLRAVAQRRSRTVRGNHLRRGAAARKSPANPAAVAEQPAPGPLRANDREGPSSAPMARHPHSRRQGAAAVRRLHACPPAALHGPARPGLLRNLAATGHRTTPGGPTRSMKAAPVARRPRAGRCANRPYGWTGTAGGVRPGCAVCCRLLANDGSLADQAGPSQVW